jgi:hypothetical protein
MGGDWIQDVSTSEGESQPRDTKLYFKYNISNLYKQIFAFL